jgi:hypothetical protein
MDHNEEDAAEMEEALETLSEKKGPPKKVRPCSLPDSTQSLLKIIFDNGSFIMEFSEL